MLAHFEHLVQTRWAYFVALVSGLLLAIAFDFAPESPLRWLAPLCSILGLLGYLFTVQFLTPKRAMRVGYLFGLAFFGWGLNWVYISMARFGGAPLVFAIMANFAVVAYLALYWLSGTYLIVKLGKTPKRRLLLAPAVIALLEWVRSVFFIGFPWLSIGYSWVDTPLAHLASYFGVLGLTFCIVLLIVLGLGAIHHRGRFVAVLVVLASVLPLSPFAPYNPDNPPTTVTLIQGNMPVITEYNNARMTQNLTQYHALTDATIAAERTDVVIWPEAAIPYFYVESSDFLDQIFAHQQSHQFDLITGIPHGDWETQAIYNSLLLQKVDARQPQFYNKSHLLPFGEYLPFRAFFAFFEDFVSIPLSDFARGETVQAPFQTGGLIFAPSICFEAVFGDEIRQNARHANILLNVSNDAWFGQSKAQIQHFNIARMRAIENQKMLVRATNDGRTAIIGQNGKVLQSLPPFAEGALTAKVYGNNQITLYAQFGDILVIALSLLWLFILFGYRVLRPRYSQNRIK